MKNWRFTPNTQNGRIEDFGRIRGSNNHSICTEISRQDAERIFAMRDSHAELIIALTAYRDGVAGLTAEILGDHVTPSLYQARRLNSAHALAVTALEHAKRITE